MKKKDKDSYDLRSLPCFTLDLIHQLFNDGKVSRTVKLRLIRLAQSGNLLIFTPIHRAYNELPI